MRKDWRKGIKKAYDEEWGLFVAYCYAETVCSVSLPELSDALGEIARQALNRVGIIGRMLLESGGDVRRKRELEEERVTVRQDGSLSARSAEYLVRRLCARERRVSEISRDLAEKTDRAAWLYGLSQISESHDQSLQRLEPYLAS